MADEEASKFWYLAMRDGALNQKTFCSTKATNGRYFLSTSIAVGANYIRITVANQRVCGLFLVALFFGSALAADAQQQKKRFDPTSLIGLEVIGTSYPDGWKQLGSDGFGSSPYILTTMKKGNYYSLLLKRQLSEPKRGERIHSLVTDAISVDDPTNLLKFSRLCYFKDEEAKKLESNIFANVGFARFCDLKTTLIRRAWKANLQTGKFELIPNTKGLVCEYGFVSIGDTDFREGCPTYGLR